MKLQLTITRKLTLIFVFFAAFLLAGSGILAYTRGRSALEAAAISDLLSIATEKEAALNRWAEDQTVDIASLAASPAIRQAAADLAVAPDPASAAEAHGRLVQELRVWGAPGWQYRGLLVLEAETGQVVAATDSAEEGEFKRDRPYFIKGQRGPYLQNLYYSPSLQELGMTAAAPLRSPGGRLVGVLAGRLNLAEMNEIIGRRTGLRQTEDSFLVNASHLLVTQPRFISEPAVLQRGIHTETVKRCLAPGSGGLSAQDYRGVPAIIVYRWLAERQLCLIVKIDQTEALAPIRALGQTLLLVGGLTLLVASLVGLVLAHTITRPVLALQAGVTRLGRGELETRLPEISNDELGQLAREFNTMAATLAANETQLRRYTEALEQQVQERTATLQASEERLRVVADTARVGLVIVDEAHRYRYANRTYLEILRLPEDNIVGRQVAEVLAPVYEGQIRPRLERAFRGERVSYELSVPASGGEVRYYAVMYEPGTDRSGAIVVVVITDITERKRAEAETRAYAARLQALADASRAFAEAGTESQAVLDLITRLTAEQLDAGCIIRLLSDDGQWLQPVSLYYGDPALLEAMQTVFGTVRVHLSDPNPAAQVVRSGQPLLIPVIDLDRMRGLVSPEIGSLLDLMRPYSTVLTPLQVQGHIIGSLSFSRYRPGQPAFTEDDLRLAQDLADRAALAISNARLFGQLQNELADRNRAEALLQKSERTLQLFVEYAPAAIAMVDRDMKYLAASRRYLADYRLKEQTLIGRSHYEIFPEIPEHWKEIHRRCLAGTIEKCDEDPFPRADGTLDWIHWEIHPWYAQAGDIGGIILFSEVITEGKRAKEQVQYQADLLQNVSDAIIATDLDFKITSWNQAAEALYGWSAAEVIGQPISLIVQTNYTDEQPEQVLKQFLEQGLWKGEALQNRKDGATITVLASVSMVKDSTGKPVGAVAVNRDITARKQAENDLRQAAAELARSNAELEQFAYIASHDLQEPLRTVAGMLQLLQRRYAGQLDARADEFINYAVDGANRMKTLITDLLAFSRVATRGQPFQPTDCAVILAGVQANLAAAIQEGGAVITHDPLPTVMADRTQLTQLFQNLIGNALKFRGDKAPVVHIGVVQKESEWLFSVRDNGIGVEAQYFERIFVIFQRLHTRQEYPGTGIGLAVCKKIVERHGGRIWVESRPGQGSTFYFTLPDRS